MRLLPAVLLISIVFVDAAAQERRLPDRQGNQWYPYLEWRIEDASVEGNPFDIEARALFVHMESGETRHTPLFYDGDDTFIIRFTGTRPGEWTFGTVSRDQDLHGWTGRVLILPNRNPDAHGFMTSFGSKWGWQGSGSAFVPQYVMAKDLRAYVGPDGRADTSKIDADIRTFMDEHGFTGFHFHTGGDWFDGENPDPKVYRALEAMVSRVHARGGACHVWMWGAKNEPGHTGPGALVGGPMSEVDRRNLSYFAARMGPIPGWSMGYGFDTENAWATRSDLDAWKKYLEDRMGYDHFLGARVSYDDKGLHGISPRPPKPPLDPANNAPIGDAYTTWLGGDYIGYTSYRPLYPRYVQALYHHPEKPSFEEDRFRLRDRPEWRYKDYDEEMTRRGLWHSAMAGGVANIWGNLLPEADEGGSQPYRIVEQIATYSRFFEGRFLREMQTVYRGPELRLTTPDATHELIYREDTEVVRIDLKHDLPVIAVDARAPYEELRLGTLSPGEHTWQAPHRSDWAIAVGDFAPIGRAGAH